MNIKSSQSIPRHLSATILAAWLATQVVGTGMPRQASAGGWLNGVPFQQTSDEIAEEHFQRCLKMGKATTRDEASRLDQQCNPLPANPTPTPTLIGFPVINPAVDIDFSMETECAKFYEVRSRCLQGLEPSENECSDAQDFTRIYCRDY